MARRARPHPAAPAPDPSTGIVLGERHRRRGVAPLYRGLYRGSAKDAMDIDAFAPTSRASASSSATAPAATR